VSAELRAKLTSAAAAIAASVGYTNAGTIEFLLDESGRFYFLEMNTRLQVEHPVTEAIAGIDLVQWQIRIARGERVPAVSEKLTPRGHAIECRIYAEDPDAGFLPSPGRITSIRVPDGPGIRDDSAVETGAEVPIFYDPLISKLVVWGADRSQAIARMRRALQEYEILGVRTTLDFFRWLLREPTFVNATFHTEWLDGLLQQRRGEPFSAADPSLEEVALVAAAIRSAMRGRSAAMAREASDGPRRPAVAPSRAQSGSEGGWAAQARREGLRE
jgi:acetyl-CoA carboxylase biotin carboxylase subunit